MSRPISLSIIFMFGKNFLHALSLILCLGLGNIPEEPWSIKLSISKGSSPLPRPPPPPLNYRRVPPTGEPPPPPRLIIGHFTQTFEKIEVQGAMFFSLKVKNFIPRNWYLQQSTKVAVFRKSMIFHSFRWMSGIRSVSCIRPTCQCRFPPLSGIFLVKI